MSIGARMGVDVGLNIGLEVGQTGSNPMATVARDAGSSKYLPASAAQWDATLAADGLSGGPTSLYLLQEGSGAPQDSIGTNHLTVFNSPTYGGAVPGWSALAVGSNDGSDAFYSTAIGNPAAQSCLAIAYLRITAAPAGDSPILSIGQGAGIADRRHAAITSAPRYNARDFTAATIDVDGTTDPSTDVRFVALLINRAASEFSVLTDQDKITTVWSAPSSGTNAYLSIFDGIGNAQCLYLAVFLGASAEKSRTQIKTIAQRLGWSPPWTP